MEKEKSTNYFFSSIYEQRKPEQAVENSELRNILFQVISLIFIVVGFNYLYWRWNSSLNLDALWFAIPLVIAETLAFIGSMLMIVNCWSNKDPLPQLAIHTVTELNSTDQQSNPISVDVFIATYNEDLDLVRCTVKDAKKMTYPFADVKITIYVLDDGKRDGSDPLKEDFKRMTQEEGVQYICRESNTGYKAGNLNNAFLQTHGDLIVILDADTRPYPDYLANTTGYFRNEKLAWVQTPQWFYDLTAGIPIKNYFETRFGKAGHYLGALFGKAKTGKDIFGNDPKLFYDVILRRRNNYNSAFCCGAGSIHRRRALEIHALKKREEEIAEELNEETRKLRLFSEKDIVHLQEKIRNGIALKPFMLHSSEDIYTSLLLHAEGWESIQHPHVLCKMLSPQDLDGCVKQRTRYAEGSLNIGLGKHSPVFLRGLTFHQRLSYIVTIYSYFSPLWLLVFLLSPAVFFFTFTPPIMAFNFDFFKHFFPFMILNTLVIMLINWGIPYKRSEQYYVASFWLFLRSIVRVLLKLDVKFNVTSKKIRSVKNTKHILPHLFILFITFCGVAYNTFLIIKDLHPSYSAYTANCMWAVYNVIQLSAFIRAGLWKSTADLTN